MKKTIIIPEDYAQSANTLFHFMNKEEYLKNILIKKALIPRYCEEDIKYLNISKKEIFSKIAILQKCFCDIPIHRIHAPFILEGKGEKYEKLLKDKNIKFEISNTHPDFYGKYAIAFSKSWGERNNLHPILYLNPNCSFVKEFTVFFNNAIDAKDLSEEILKDILNRLAYMKPIRGSMKRFINYKKFSTIYSNEPIEGKMEIEFSKNFCDEQEWRYVPNLKELNNSNLKTNLDIIIANPSILQNSIMMNNLNNRIAKEEYQDLWLHFNYEDIKYIIVPDKNARLEFIKIIKALSNNNFKPKNKAASQKLILISKILVLEDIRKDW